MSGSASFGMLMKAKMPRQDHDRNQRDSTSARVVNRPVDDAGHDLVPALPKRSSTFCPLVTNCWPTVMTVTCSGRPVTHMPSASRRYDLDGHEADDAVLNDAHADDAGVVQHQIAGRNFLRF